MRVVRLVGGDVLCGDDRVKRLGQPALRERDEVAVAVGQEGELPALRVKCTEGWTDVGKNGPVWDGRRERGGVVVLEFEPERRRGSPQCLGEHHAIPPKRLLLLDLRLELDIG